MIGPAADELWFHLGGFAATIGLAVWILRGALKKIEAQEARLSDHHTRLSLLEQTVSLFRDMLQREKRGRK